MMMIYPAVLFLVAAAGTGAWINARRRPGTSRDWKKQVPTLVLLAISLVLFVVAVIP